MTSQMTMWFYLLAPSILLTSVLCNAEVYSEESSDPFSSVYSSQKRIEVSNEAPASDGSEKIVLLPKVTIDGEFIYLGNISQCTGDEDFCGDLANIEIGPAPLACREIVLQKTEIQRLLQKEWPSADKDLGGSERVAVKSNCYEVTNELIQKTLIAKIKNLLPDDSEIRISIESIRLPHRIFVRTEDFTLEFTSLKTAENISLEWILNHYSGLQNVDVSLKDNDQGTNPSSFMITVLFKAEKKLPVLVKNLPPNSRLDKENFEIEWTMISKNTPFLVDDLVMLENKILKSSGSVGKPILKSQISIPILVQKGQMVQLILRSGALEVTSKTKALSSGGKGETIEVQYPATKRILQARIIDPLTVEVNL